MLHDISGLSKIWRILIVCSSEIPFALVTTMHIYSKVPAFHSPNCRLNDMKN